MIFQKPRRVSRSRRWLPVENITAKKGEVNHYLTLLNAISLPKVNLLSVKEAVVS